MRRAFANAADANVCRCSRMRRMQHAAHVAGGRQVQADRDLLLLPLDLCSKCSDLSGLQAQRAGKRMALHMWLMFAVAWRMALHMWLMALRVRLIWQM